jgi:hypothetical protein
MENPVKNYFILSLALQKVRGLIVGGNRDVGSNATFE